MDPLWASFVQAAISLVTGGLAGAAVNAFVTTRRQRLDVTLFVIKDFFAFYEDIGKAKGIFTAPDLKTTLDQPTNFNILRRVGDWHHYVASLVLGNAVDISLLNKVGVTKEIESFSEALSSAKSRCPQYLDPVWGWWPNLQDFRTRRK